MLQISVVLEVLRTVVILAMPSMLVLGCSDSLTQEFSFSAKVESNRSDISQKKAAVSAEYIAILKSIDELGIDLAGCNLDYASIEAFMETARNCPQLIDAGVLGLTAGTQNPRFVGQVPAVATGSTSSSAAPTTTPTTASSTGSRTISFIETYDFTNAAAYRCEGGPCNSTNLVLANGAVQLAAIASQPQTSTAAEWREGTISTATQAADLIIASNQLTLDAARNGAHLDKSWTPHYEDLLIYLKFEGDWTDSSPGTAYHATIGGGDPTNNVVAGKVGRYAADFDGDDFLISNYDLAMSPTNDYTFMFWMKGIHGGNRPVGAQASFGTTADWFIGSDNKTGGRLQIYGRFHNTRLSVGGATDVRNSSDWNHVAVVMHPTAAGEAYSVYLNGRLMGTGTGWLNGYSNSFTHQPFYIGASRNSDASAAHAITGQMDEFALFSEALTADEIQTIYHRQNQPYSGEYTSKIFDVGRDLEMAAVQWESPRPARKPVVAGATTNAYSEVSGTLGNGLIASWGFDESFGTVTRDRTGNGHSATVSSAAGSVTVGEMGLFGRAFRIEDRYLEVAANDEFNTDEFGISAWLHPNANYSTAAEVGNDIIFGFESDSRFHLAYDGETAFTRGHSISLNVNMSTTGWVNDIEADTAASFVDPRTWNHVYAGFDGTTAVLYLNGVLVDSASYAGEMVATNNEKIIIGKGYNGLIDEVDLWNRGLTPAEVLELYRRGSEGIDIIYRTCATANCLADENWVGPAGASAFFNEWVNVSEHSSREPWSTADRLATRPLLLLANFASPAPAQYFQYKVMLSSYDRNNVCSGATQCVPSLSSVSLLPDNDAGEVAQIRVDGKHSFETAVGRTFSTLSAIAITDSGACATYQVSRDDGATYRYWNGSAWAPALSSSNAATAATVQANITALESGTFRIRGFLNNSSATGTDNCSVSNIQLHGAITN